MASLRTLLLLLLPVFILGLFIGGYYGPPSPRPPQVPSQEPPLKGKAIRLGYIAATTTGLETGRAYRDRIIQPDMNEYTRLLGYDTRFEWVIDDAKGQSTVHLEKVQTLKDLGVSVFEGGGWSSMASAALSYCNSNRMLMWSSSSTSPTLAIPGDYLYRLAPPETHRPVALARVAYSYGIRRICIIQRNDTVSESYALGFAEAYTKLGGALTGAPVRYTSERQDYSRVLAEAERQTAVFRGQGEPVGVLAVAFDELFILLGQAKATSLTSLTWFTTYDSINVRTADSPSVLEVVKCFTVSEGVPANSRYLNVATRYTELTRASLSLLTANQYDIAFILMSGVLEAQSTKGADIVSLMQPICARTFGASGWCRVDDNGDRASLPYDILGFGQDPSGGIRILRYGSCDPDTGTVTWSSLPGA